MRHLLFRASYLPKPVDPARLASALQRLPAPGAVAATDHPREASRGDPALTETDRVLLKGDERNWFIPVRSIVLLESEGNSTRIHFDDRNVLLPRSLQSLERRLNLPMFFRANRSQIISLRAVTDVTGWFSGGLKVTLRQGSKVEISRRQATLFRQQNSP